jgi:plasmid stabilization system protein ParE
MFDVIVTKEAHNDALEAFLYYEEKQQGLGERFLTHLRECYLSLAQHPTHYGFIDEDPLKILRDLKIDKFPYVIVFEIREASVVIYAVHNTFKHPINKLRKL